jgi:hypothetical protein
MIKKFTVTVYLDSVCDDGFTAATSHTVTVSALWSLAALWSLTLLQGSRSLPDI